MLCRKFQKIIFMVTNRARFDACTFTSFGRVKAYVGYRQNRALYILYINANLRCRKIFDKPLLYFSNSSYGRVSMFQVRHKKAR